MKCRGRKASKHLGNLIRRNTTELVRSFTDREFGEHRTAGDRRHATLRLEPDRRDRPALHANREPQNVPADGIGHLHHRRGIGQVPRVAGVPKMVENGFVEHQSEYKGRRIS